MSTFKVGDWVIMKRNGNILKWTEEDELIPSRRLEVKPWTPQPGEWCWFWNENSKLPTLTRLQRANKDGTHYWTDMGTRGEFFGYSYCEPFIGQLPSWIKE